MDKVTDRIVPLTIAEQILRTMSELSDEDKRDVLRNAIKIKNRKGGHDENEKAKETESSRGAAAE